MSFLKSKTLYIATFFSFFFIQQLFGHFIIKQLSDAGEVEKESQLKFDVRFCAQVSEILIDYCNAYNKERTEQERRGIEVKDNLFASIFLMTTDQNVVCYISIHSYEELFKKGEQSVCLRDILKKPDDRSIFLELPLYWDKSKESPTNARSITQIHRQLEGVSPQSPIISLTFDLGNTSSYLNMAPIEISSTKEELQAIKKKRYIYRKAQAQLQTTKTGLLYTLCGLIEGQLVERKDKFDHQSTDQRNVLRLIKQREPILKKLKTILKQALKKPNGTVIVLYPKNVVYSGDLELECEDLNVAPRKELDSEGLIIKSPCGKILWEQINGYFILIKVEKYPIFPFLSISTSIDKKYQSDYLRVDTQTGEVLKDGEGVDPKIEAYAKKFDDAITKTVIPYLLDRRPPEIELLAMPPIELSIQELIEQAKHSFVQEAIRSAIELSIKDQEAGRTKLIQQEAAEFGKILKTIGKSPFTKKKELIKKEATQSPEMLFDEEGTARKNCERDERFAREDIFGKSHQGLEIAKKAQAERELSERVRLEEVAIENCREIVDHTRKLMEIINSLKTDSRTLNETIQKIKAKAEQINSVIDRKRKPKKSWAEILSQLIRLREELRALRPEEVIATISIGKTKIDQGLGREEIIKEELTLREKLYETINKTPKPSRLSRGTQTEPIADEESSADSVGQIESSISSSQDKEDILKHKCRKIIRLVKQCLETINSQLQKMSAESHCQITTAIEKVETITESLSKALKEVPTNIEKLVRLKENLNKELKKLDKLHEELTRRSSQEPIKEQEPSHISQERQSRALIRKEIPDFHKRSHSFPGVDKKPSDLSQYNCRYAADKILLEYFELEDFEQWIEFMELKRPEDISGIKQKKGSFALFKKDFPHFGIKLLDSNGHSRYFIKYKVDSPNARLKYVFLKLHAKPITSLSLLPEIKRIIREACAQAEFYKD